MNYKTYSAPKSQEITLQQLFDFQPNIAPLFSVLRKRNGTIDKEKGMEP